MDLTDSLENLEITGANEHSPWKAAFLRKRRIEQAWKNSQVNARELVGHDDHVVTCLQFDGNRIVSGSDDNTLKVKLLYKFIYRGDYLALYTRVDYFVTDILFLIRFILSFERFKN